MQATINGKKLASQKFETNSNKEAEKRNNEPLYTSLETVEWVSSGGDVEPFIDGKPVAEDIKCLWEEETYKYPSGSVKLIHIKYLNELEQGLMGNGGKSSGKWESNCGGNFGL
ncbi:hypothetical protein Q3G72_026690 [Acer saccharum]|nr:hypothetical protein Q3G72_026690 [Acer saccharum]